MSPDYLKTSTTPSLQQTHPYSTRFVRDSSTPKSIRLNGGRRPLAFGRKRHIVKGSSIPIITVNPILKEESRWVRQLQYTYMTDEVTQWQKRVMTPCIYGAKWETWMELLNTWVWVRLASDLNIESPRNKMMPRHLSVPIALSWEAVRTMVGAVS